MNSPLASAARWPIPPTPPRRKASSTGSTARLGPDVLVNTIGTFRPGDALSTTPEMLLLMIDINLGPALWLSQAVAGASYAAAGLGVPSCTWSPVRGSSHPAASRPTA